MHRFSAANFGFPTRSHEGFDMKLLQLFLSFVFVVVSCEQVFAEGSSHQARKSNDFVESIGVNTHTDYLDTPYGKYERLVKPSLLYLGVRHIRDSLADDELSLKPFRDLSRYGIKLTGLVPYETTSMPALVARIKFQNEVLEAVEGPNETDIFTQFKYKRQGFPKGTIAFMKDFYRAMKQDRQLRHLPVLQTTLAFPGNKYGRGDLADRLGNLAAYADYGNSHNYLVWVRFQV
jgi:hypothetical protein